MISQFDVIKDLLIKCRKDELKTIRAFITTFNDGTGSHRNKSLSLFELLLKKKDITEKAACQSIYGDDGSKSFQSFKRLLNRLKSKIYESLCLDINVYKPNNLSEVSQYRLEMRKLIMYFFVLRGRLLNQEFVRLIERAIYIAKKYELYYDIVNLLYAKSEILSFVSSFEKLKNIDNEIEYYQKAQDAMRKASIWHQKLILSLGSKAGGYQDINDFAIAIDQLSSDVKTYKSANIEYFLLMIKMEYSHKLHDYKTAEEISFRQLELYKTSPSVYLKAREAAAFLNLGNNQMHLFKFNQAYKSVVASYPTYSAYFLNLFIAKEIEFYIHFYSGNLANAEILINEIILKGGDALN